MIFVKKNRLLAKTVFEKLKFKRKYQTSFRKTIPDYYVVITGQKHVFCIQASNTLPPNLNYLIIFQ
jgi:hypothetical protein